MKTRSALIALALVTGMFGTIISAQDPPAGQAAAARGGRGGARTPESCGPNSAELKNVAKDSRCFELRTYTLRPDGSGNIDLLHARFRQHSIRLLQKHGMTIVGFWQPVSKPDTLIYLVAYKDAAARDAAWAAFNADPEWVKVRTEMAVSVQVESTFMVATDYGPIK
jgi:hypothetical protein